jgi:hypothetical protein
MRTGERRHRVRHTPPRHPSASNVQAWRVQHPSARCLPFATTDPVALIQITLSIIAGTYRMPHSFQILRVNVARRRLKSPSGIRQGSAETRFMYTCEIGEIQFTKQIESEVCYRGHGISVFIAHRSLHFQTTVSKGNRHCIVWNIITCIESAETLRMCGKTRSGARRVE